MNKEEQIKKMIDFVKKAEKENYLKYSLEINPNENKVRSDIVYSLLKEIDLEYYTDMKGDKDEN